MTKGGQFVWRLNEWAIANAGQNAGVRERRSSASRRGHRSVKLAPPRLGGLPAWCGALAVFASAQSAAQANFFSDIEAFSAQSATVVVEDFERFASAGTELPGFERNAIAYAPASQATNVYVLPAPENPAAASSTVVTSAVLTASGSPDLVITFDTPQRAVGFDTYLDGSPVSVRVFGESNKLIGHVAHVHAADELGFFGVVSNERIVSVQLSANGAAPFSTGIDNIRAAGISRLGVHRTGEQANFISSDPSVSADGRYVAFWSDATNLVAEDTNNNRDVFVHDRVTGETDRVSVSSDDVEGNGYSQDFSMSTGGRHVAFVSLSTNFVADDTNRVGDIFIRDRMSGTTTRISVSSTGAGGNSFSAGPSVSADGRYVAFYSDADNLVENDDNGMWDVFVRDRMTEKTTRVSVSSANVEANAESWQPALSADGRFVAFLSSATNLVAGDTNGERDVFVHDLTTGETTRANLSPEGLQSDGSSFGPLLSADARYVTFESRATNLVPGDLSGQWHVLVHDRASGETTRASVSSQGVPGDNYSFSSSIDANARYVTYSSDAANLAENDTNAKGDVFVHDRDTGTTIRASVSATGVQGDHFSAVPSLSADGRFLAFASPASNLVAGDANTLIEIFVRVIDQDGDGAFDEQDNCLATANPKQANADSDGRGDACDADDDNDGMPDTFEMSHGFDPFNPADAELDADGDGEGNLAEFHNRTNPRNPASNLANSKRGLQVVAQLIQIILLDD